VITDYKRARKDAAFLVGWAKARHNHPTILRYLEAFAVMNAHDAVNIFALALNAELPQLPESESAEAGGVPETGA
jgi:hypothetical protein